MITIPKISELYDSIINDLEASFGGTIPTFGRNFLRAMAAVQAAKLKIYYLAIAGIQKNLFVDTADSEFSGGSLERFGRVKLGRDPFPSTQGSYEVEVTGLIGATILASTTFKSDDTASNAGKLYILDDEYTLVATTDTITIRALEGGIDSKLSVTDTLTATSPIANVSSNVEVTSETIEPLDAEDLEVYRQLIIDSYRIESQGGASGDYILWATDAQGVARVYPYANSGEANTIDIYVEATIADSTDGKGTPSSGLLDDVEEVVELDPDTTKDMNERGRRPLGVFQINYLPVVVKDVEIEIIGFVDLTAGKQALILDSITLVVESVRPFISGVDLIDERNDTLDKNKIIAAILKVVPTATFTSITLIVDSVDLETYTFLNGDIPFLDSITYS